MKRVEEIRPTLEKSSRDKALGCAPLTARSCLSVHEEPVLSAVCTKDIAAGCLEAVREPIKRPDVQGPRYGTSAVQLQEVQHRWRGPGLEEVKVI